MDVEILMLSAALKRDADLYLSHAGGGDENSSVGEDFQSHSDSDMMDEFDSDA